MEVTARVRIKAHDLAIHQRVCRSDALRDFFGQIRPVLEGFPLRDVSVQRCPRTEANARKPSCFSSNSHAGWLKGSGRRTKGMGTNERIF
jgi:hypothetical protein